MPRATGPTESVNEKTESCITIIIDRNIFGVILSCIDCGSCKLKSNSNIKNKYVV